MSPWDWRALAVDTSGPTHLTVTPPKTVNPGIMMTTMIIIIITTMMTHHDEYDDDDENNHRVSGFGRISIKDDVMTTTMMITITTMTAMSTFQHLSV